MEVTNVRNAKEGTALMIRGSATLQRRMGIAVGVGFLTMKRKENVGSVDQGSI